MRLFVLRSRCQGGSLPFDTKMVVHAPVNGWLSFYWPIPAYGFLLSVITTRR